ncbi:hypothetical protein AQ490_16760 [Wenjunlia vitaminophila]|uniref:Uncharacterized protein n=1 Tax=Wenjunlia vitaminophila TaxID=76728 RepID=A0A0T6LXR8_WENVI|nr:hypothetical protein [Wenjunlia vitaminophila]KRV50658.1 hypothetical protein AQ490_16555 [Wenjunlia vitaminophila]KRV50693.1 hypothetical protein AQ490_16760 [Wenjunlia vitaminophila]
MLATLLALVGIAQPAVAGHGTAANAGHGAVPATAPADVHHTGSPDSHADDTPWTRPSRVCRDDTGHRLLPVPAGTPAAAPAVLPAPGTDTVRPAPGTAPCGRWAAPHRGRAPPPPPGT